MSARFHVEHSVLYTTNQQLNSHRSCDRTDDNQSLSCVLTDRDRAEKASPGHSGSTQP